MMPKGRTRWLRKTVQQGLVAGLTGAYHRLAIAPEDYLQQLQQAHGLPIHSFDDLYSLPLEIIDDIADETVSAAKKLAAIEGSGLGLFGFFTLAPDMAILASISLQMMQKLSLVYGFQYTTDQEKAELWVAAASAFGLDVGKELLEKEVLEGFVGRIIARISARLGAEVAEKIPGKVIPLLSGLIGGTLNYYFVRQWGRRVKRHFREKHLAVRAQRHPTWAPHFAPPAELPEST